MQYSVVKNSNNEEVPFITAEVAGQSLPTATYTKTYDEATDQEQDTPPKRRPGTQGKPGPRRPDWGRTVTENVETTD